MKFLITKIVKKYFCILHKGQFFSLKQKRVVHLDNNYRYQISNPLHIGTRISYTSILKP